MNILVGDIGNTKTKICLVKLKTYKIVKLISFNSNVINSPNSLKKRLATIGNKKNLYRIALFSSVVPKHTLKMKKILKRICKIRLVEIKEKNIKKIVKIKLKNKNQIGSDRIANAVGVFKKYKSNCIVLDFGTATTFDVVDKNGVYNGGIIAPGVNLSLNSLVTSADQIPAFSLKIQKKIIGRNTIEDLRSGFYWGYTGLINNIILKIEKETKKKYKIIFTGGYAELFKTSIIRRFIIDKNITIAGIIEILKHNRKYLN